MSLTSPLIEQAFTFIELGLGSKVMDGYARKCLIGLSEFVGRDGQI